MEQLDLIKPEVDTRLSHSSANLLRSCERRYWHYKINNTPVDSDYNQDMQAFAVGKVFHQVLEDNDHVKPEKIVNAIEGACEAHKCNEEHIPMLHAMLLRYYEEHKKIGLEVVKCEYKIDTEQIIGYVDVVMKDKEDNWYIVDLKTYKSLYYVKPANLTMDYQLNLYAAHIELMAEHLNLDVKKYKGCILRVVTKPSLKQRKEETYVEYVSRLKNSAGCKMIDFNIPKKYMNPEEVYMSHIRLYEQSLEMRKWDDKGSCNFNSCFNYNSPCQFYSQCHDGTFTELSGELS